MPKKNITKSAEKKKTTTKKVQKEDVSKTPITFEDKYIMNSSAFSEMIKNNHKISETLIPELLKRLIRESVPNDTYYCVPFGDDIYIPGVDGFISDNKVEHKYLPSGNCFFEIGAETTTHKAIAKIKSDYEKRKVDSNISDKKKYNYIAITTTEINTTKKNEFKKNVDEIFKSTRILDSVDLLDWLSEHLDIFIWFIRQYGKNIGDSSITLLEDEWRKIATVTKPNLNYDLFKISQGKNIDKLLDMLSTKNQIITISSYDYGWDFAFDFCVATLMSCSYDLIKNRTIIVNNQSGLDYVNMYCKGKIVLINFNCTNDRFSDVLINTYVFFENIFNLNCNDIINLEKIEQNSFEEVVNQIGIDKDEVSRISYLVGYNPLVLRRTLTSIPSIKIPEWSRKKQKYELAPLLLMGKIDMYSVADKLLLHKLLGETSDNYSEILNIWSEMNQSPIAKGENYFKINSRDECFTFLQIDPFSTKIKIIEDFIFELFFKDDLQLKEEYNLRYSDFNRIIEDVIEGFLILLSKNSKWGLHFDLFVNKILDELNNQPDRIERVYMYFPLLVSLSISNCSQFLKDYMKNEEAYRKFVNYKPRNSYFNQHLYNILSALSIMLENEKYALDAFKMLIDLYFIADDDSYLFDEVLKYLKPISTMVGIIALPVSKKIEYFFRLIEGKNVEKSYKLVKKLYDSSSDSIMIYESKKRSYKRKNYPVTYQEIFGMKNKLFSWLYNRDNNGDAKIEMLKSLLNNIHVSEEKVFIDQLALLQEGFKNEADDVKIIVIQEILETRENILQFPDWSWMKKYIDSIDKFVDIVQPFDVYMKNKLILLNDNYPLLNPPCIDDDDWHQKKDELRVARQSEVFEILYNQYGDKLFEMLIVDSYEDSFSVYELLFSKSKDHKHDLELMLSNKKTRGIRVYLNMIEDDSISKMIGDHLEDDIIISNLPYKKVVFDLVNGCSKENKYWENQRFDLVENVDFDFLFDKFLEYAPLNMVSYFAYIRETNYSHLIRLVKTIVDKYTLDNNNQQILNETYEIQELISKMDNLYFTEELSQYEYKLLPILKGNLEDYPLGVKKYFWKNPRKFSSLMAELFSKKDSLEYGSLEKEILFDALYSFDSKCFIPAEYITLRKEELMNWCIEYMGNYNNQDKETIDFLNRVLARILASCPKEKNMEIWPIKEVADIVEKLTLDFYDDSKEIASSFAVAYLNRRGVRSVENGVREKEIALEFSKYSEIYQLTHPTISKALDIISNDYSSIADHDKKYATDRED